jgi:transcriptional regulator with GAF, ATPase, and Fis domain
MNQHLQAIQRAAQNPSNAEETFALLNTALSENVGFMVLTVLRIDWTTFTSKRLYSTEPTYPIGAVKRHVRSAWSDAVLDRRSVFLAPSRSDITTVFPDAESIFRAGCGSIIALPIVDGSDVLGTVNLWHRDGYYDRHKAEAAWPFAVAIAPVSR